MGVNLYTLKKRAVMVLPPDGCGRAVHLLQLAVVNALSPDVQKAVDRAIQNAYSDWESWLVLPEQVVQTGIDRVPKPGAPIFSWGHKRVYCFEGDLLNPVGFLGNKELGGFAFRSPEEQKWLDDLTTARAIDEGHATVYQDFWTGRIFQSGQDFLAYRRGNHGHDGCIPQASRHRRESSSHRLTKIRRLIKLLEVKGEQASMADIQFLANLREKAAQLSSCDHMQN